MARTGRPKKENGKRKVEIFAVTERESREIKEFSMLSKMTKSEFIRSAIEDKIQSIRDEFGWKKSDDECFYDDFDDYEGNELDDE